MTITLYMPPAAGLFDSSGDPLSGGLVNTYVSGTTTAKNSYPTQDDAAAQTNANANPVVLDSNGRAQIWLDGVYKVVVTDSAGSTIQTVDEYGLVTDADVYDKEYLQGLEVTLDTDTDHDVNVTAGEARDVSDTSDIVLTGEITKRVDATWAVGDDNGGLDTSTVAATSIYYIWLIQRSDTGVEDVLISLSASSPTMPTSYDKKRLIGVGKTDGSSNWTFVSKAGWTDYHNCIFPDSATTDAYAVAPQPVHAQYFTGMRVRFRAATLNTAASTLNLNGLGAKALEYNGDAVVTGDIIANQIVEAEYEGTAFQMLTPPNVLDGAQMNPRAASDTVAGIQENATDAEGITGTATDRTMTPANVQAKVASATAKGIIEQTTPAEDVLGADTARATTAAGIAAAAQGMLWHSITSTGSADVQVLTPVPAITAYAAYQQWFFLPVADNTGACTLNVSGLGTRNIRKIDGAGALTDPAAGDLDTVVVAHVIDDGAQLILQNPAVSTGATLANLGIPNHDDIDVSANGEMTIPTQPSFLAWCDAQANVTGDNTNYIVEFVNEIFDQNADYNTSNSQFTAPVTGKYYLGTCFRADGVTSNHTRAIAQMYTSNGNFEFMDVDATATAGGPSAATLVINGSGLVDMDASDSAYVRFIVYTTDKTVDIAAGSSTNNLGSFFGCLVH
jgi:hypothetical protein